MRESVKLYRFAERDTRQVAMYHMKPYSSSLVEDRMFVSSALLDKAFRSSRHSQILVRKAYGELSGMFY